MGSRILGAMVVGLVVSWLAACGVGQFTCEADAQCVGQGPGVCQPDGYCSFPAADCPAGQRYGEHSGPQSGRCVGEGGETESTGAATSSTVSNGGSTTAPDDTTGPALDTGLGTTLGVATAETSASTGPATTDEASSGSIDSGEPGDPDLVLWLALDRAPLGDVLDSSTYMGNGTCENTGCPQADRGVVSGGAGFDGMDDVITVPHAMWLETTEAFTIASFIRVGTVPLDFRAVMAKPLGPMLANSWELYFQDELFHAGMSGAAAGEQWDVTTPWPFPPEQWVHVAATWDGGLLTLWLDAAEAGSIEVPALVLDDQPIHIGADDDQDPAGPVGFFLGTMDDVRVYRRALTADELAVLASP